MERRPMGVTDQPAPTSGRVAVATAVAVATVLYVAACAFGGSYGTAFFAIPVFVGFTAGVLFPTHPYRASFYALATASFLAVATLREGVVCLLFSLPVLVPMLMVGAFAGSVFRARAQSRRAQRAGIGMMLFIGIGWQIVGGRMDDPRMHPRHAAEASIVIDAAPSDVFALLTSGELRVAPRWPWFLRIGLPIPERMLVEKPGPDGNIRFDFSQGTAFANITAWSPGRELRYSVNRYEIRDLPFHITRLGRTPDYGLRSERVQDWLTLDDTRYTLSPSPTGGTILVRRIAWRRHLAPDLYFGWLQQAVMERAQVRLLELIRDRAHQRGPSPHGFVLSYAAPR
jgi:hypothetical protein